MSRRALLRSLRWGGPRAVSSNCVLLGGLLVALCGGCSPSEEEVLAAARRKDPRPNVLFVCIDTLRADHLGYQGYERPTSPNLDALSKESACFLRCMSSYPQTVPSVATLMTGLYPSAHGKYSLKERVPEEVDTLAELFRDAGYATGGIVTNPHLEPGGGYEQGFDYYCYLTGNRNQAPPNGATAAEGSQVERREVKGRYPHGPSANERALAWLRQSRSVPYYAYVHYMDVHNPYEGPREYREKFVEVEGATLYGKGPLVNPASDVDMEYTRAQYDGQILYMDMLLKELLDTLEAEGRMENTILVVTADHGEELFDHGGVGHGSSLYSELLHVPLLIRGPGIEPRTFDQLVASVDVLPTVCELAGLDSPPGKQGFSLVPWIREGSSQAPRPPVVWSENRGNFDRDRKRRPALAITTQDWRYLRWDESGRQELFRALSDGREKEDVSASHPEVIAEMQAHVDAFRASMDLFHWDDQGPREIDPKTVELLRAIGYDGE